MKVARHAVNYLSFHLPHSEFEFSLSLCSPFIMECLKEFYMTYDDTHLRWNGADLLTRVARKFLSKENESVEQWELNVQPSYIFFPIGLKGITRYSSHLLLSVLCIKSM